MDINMKFLVFLYITFMIFIVLPISIWKFIESYEFYNQLLNNKLTKFEKFTISFFPSLFDSFIWFIALLILSPILCPLGYIDSIMLLFRSDPKELITINLIHIFYKFLKKKERKNDSQ